jgi:hypothetical protein
MVVDYAKKKKPQDKKLLLLTRKQNILPTMQYGCRQGKRMLDIVTCLVTNIRESFKSRHLTVIGIYII